MKTIKRIAERFCLSRSHTNSNRYQIWNLAIFQHYRSNETGFVEFCDCGQNVDLSNIKNSIQLQIPNFLSVKSKFIDLYINPDFLSYSGLNGTSLVF